MIVKIPSMIAIDHEYLSETAPSGDTPGERPDVQRVYCEIMQIGACKLDAHGVEIGTLNVTIQPHRLRNIPLWLSRMTGISEEKRAAGLPYPEALRQLVEFIGDDNDIWTFSGDWWVVEGNVRAHKLPMPFQQPFQRVKPLLEEKGVTLEKFKQAGFTEVCSGGLYKVLGITLPAIEGVGAHDAAHDARSLAYAIFHLKLESSL
ncbi:hypothetical protein KBD34_01800 [Patescibacteria group bacterium]|nr:hypothetical protein [Patescibacteria group bacterium]